MSRIRNASIGLTLIAAGCFFQPHPAFAASGEMLNATRLVKDASGMSGVAPDESGKLFRKAFQSALSMTQPGCTSRQREEALALATRCLHPDIFPEVRIAIDTYLSLYPKGRHVADVLVHKALIDYAEGMSGNGDAAITSAIAVARGREKTKLTSLQLDGHLTARKFRSAEAYLKDMPSGNRRVRRDQKKFKRGSELMAEALEQVRAGKLTGDSAVRALEEALETGYFGATAPEASLELVSKLDRQQPAYHRCEVSFLDQMREHRHNLAPNQRLDKMVSFLHDYPEADEELRGRAMLHAAAICRYELRDAAQANAFMEDLGSLPSWSARVDLERQLGTLTEQNLNTPEFRDAIKAITVDHAQLLPYDNGILPVVTVENLRELEALNATLTGSKDALSTLLDTYTSTSNVRGIPMQAIYLAAADRRLLAWESIEAAGNSIDAREKKLMQEILRPFFLMTSSGDRKILSALALFDRFPVKSVDVLLSYLTDHPHVIRSQHALALLADLYQKHQSYIKAQSVWNTLRKFYPRSVWIR